MHWAFLGDLFIYFFLLLLFIYLQFYSQPFSRTLPCGLQGVPSLKDTYFTCSSRFRVSVRISQKSLKMQICQSCIISTANDLVIGQYSEIQGFDWMNNDKRSLQQ